MSTTPPPAPAPAKKGSGCLTGCLIAFVVMLVLCGVGGYLLVTQGKNWAASAVQTIMVKVVENSELSEEDKKEVIAQIDRVAEGVKSGKIDVEKMTKIFKSLTEGPLMPLIIVYTAEQKYLNPSGLSNEEKEEAKLTLQRVARGASEKKISREDLQKLADLITTTTKDSNGETKTELKESLTDEELRAFLAEAKRLADDAGIPEEPYQVKIGEEFKKAIDQALGEPK